jgi:hypothetical protein
MSHFITFLLIVLFTALSLAAHAERPSPGMYSITTTMESDMPMPTQTKTMTECLTEEDIAQDPQSLMGGQDEANECDISQFSMEDGEMGMSMVCATPGGEMTMNTEGTYDATGYTMHSNMRMTGGGMTFNMKSTGVGKRIGDC